MFHNIKYRFHEIARGEAYRYEHIDPVCCREAARLFAKRHAAEGFALNWRITGPTTIIVWRPARARLRLVA